MPLRFEGERGQLPFMTRSSFSGWQRLMLLVLVLFSLAGLVRAADTDIVINEIMYHPPFDLDELQYVELFNRGSSTVDLSKWSFTRGIEFVFPVGTRLAAGAYLVVCRNAKTFSANYGSGIPLVGDFSGRLSHRGERLELSNGAGKLIDSVRYSDHDPWPAGADGQSASLERICPFISGREPSNWAASEWPAFEKLAGTPGRQNSNFSANPLPVIEAVTFKPPPPTQNATITAEVSSPAGVKAVTLLAQLARTGDLTREREVSMQRTAGDQSKGTYQAFIGGQPAGTLVRFRIKAVATTGATRLKPSPNEPRPTYSYVTQLNTNSAQIAFAYVVNVSQPESETQISVWNGRTFHVPASPIRGNGAFIYVPPRGGEILTFDHVHIRPRKGGFKVHFPKEHSFKGMTGINVIFEGPPRWMLSEPMAYEVYRAAGAPACLTEHVRVWLDGRLLGYHLLIEQPNKAFLSRNKRDDTGYLYKVNWAGQGLIGQHEKKTRPASGYEDLVGLHRGLTARSGAEQWDFIQKNFNVEEFINYYAVNMCIQNWDGFFNNYWIYHDSHRTGKWEMYPWDEDKTWGDYDGASPAYDWYEMPLTFGANNNQPSRRGGFFGGGGGWWRPPGYFSGPLLANLEFRRAFLARLGDICKQMFTEEKILPLIDAMEKRLEPEMPVRAQVLGEDPREALRRFHSDVQSLRNQVKNRRKFILSEIPKDWASR